MCRLLSGRADVGGLASRRAMKRPILTRSHRRALSATSTTRCICVLATVAMVTAPAAAATVPARRPVTSRRKPRPRVVLATKHQPQSQHPGSSNAASVAAAATLRPAARPRMLPPSPGPAPSDLRHELAGSGRPRPPGRRRRPAAAMDRPTAVQPAASNRTSSRTSGRCRCRFPANK